MPSTSAKQARLMAAAAHDPEFAERVGVPQSVAHEFNEADKGGALLRQRRQAKRLRQKPDSTREVNT